jgi:hypothetical protein
MSFCFVRLAILTQPCPNTEKVLWSPNWSLAACIVQISKRIWSFVASQCICMTSSFPMIQNLGYFTQYMELQYSSGQVLRVARYLITYSMGLQSGTVTGIKLLRNPPFCRNPNDFFSNPPSLNINKLKFINLFHPFECQESITLRLTSSTTICGICMLDQRTSLYG